MFFPESIGPRDFQCCVCFWLSSPHWARASSFTWFLDHTQQRTTLWTSDQLVAKAFTWQHTTLTTNIHAPGEIRTYNPSRRTAADLRLRRRGHWDRLFQCYTFVNMVARHPKFLILTHPDYCKYFQNETKRLLQGTWTSQAKFNNLPSTDIPFIKPSLWKCSHAWSLCACLVCNTVSKSK